jgi:hypothetical protein
MYQDLFQRYRDRLADVHDSDVDKVYTQIQIWRNSNFWRSWWKKQRIGARSDKQLK